MKTLSEIASITALLAALVVLPAILIGIRQAADQAVAALPHHATALEEAEFWARTFVP